MNDDFLPTRTGDALGKGTERAMLDKAGTGVRTVFETLADGRVARLQVQNGLKRFTVEDKVSSTVDDCIKGPFVEREAVDVEYLTRGYYEDAKVWAWGNLASVAVKALKYLVVEGRKSKRLMFVFRWQNEPEPGDLPTAAVKFQEEDFAARDYYDEADSIMLPATLRTGAVYARFKAVVAPIKKVSCLKGMSVEFADKGSDGENPTTQGCVKKTLAERFADTRVFVGEWIKSIFLTTSTGGASVTVVDEKGFLTPTETGDKLACTDIPAIGTRILGVRIDDMTYLNNGKQRDCLDYEKGSSPTLVFLRDRELLPPDKFGNVAGFLWRPVADAATRGPDVAVTTSTYPFVRHTFRLNSDNSVWFVQVTAASDTSFTFSATPLGGGAGQTLVVPFVWGAAQTAAMSDPDAANSLQVILDVSRHGDKIIVAWIDVQNTENLPGGPIMALEIAFTGDFPTAAATTRWVLTGPTTVPPAATAEVEHGCVLGVHFDPDTDEAMWALKVQKKTGQSFGRVWGASGLTASYADTDWIGFAKCPVLTTSLPAVTYSKGVTLTHTEVGTVVEVSGSGPYTYIYDLAVTNTYTDAAGVVLATATTTTPRFGSYVGEGSIPPASTVDWMLVSVPWADALYMGHKLFETGTGWGLDRIAVSAGVRAVAPKAVNCLLNADGSGVGSDAVTAMAMRNPVDGTVTFVGVPTNGFVNGLFSRFNFV